MDDTLPAKDPDRLRKLYMDFASWETCPKVDDFLVAIGKTQSNTIYHVAQVTRTAPLDGLRAYRVHMKVMHSDLQALLRRDRATQCLFPFRWYPRTKKRAS